MYSKNYLSVMLHLCTRVVREVCLRVIWEGFGEDWEGFRRPSEGLSAIGWDPKVWQASFGIISSASGDSRLALLGLIFV